MPSSSRAFALAVGFHLGLAGSLFAVGQVVTSVSTTTTVAGGADVDGLHYDGNTQRVDSFADALGVSYSIIPDAATYTAAARNGTPDQSSAWYYLNGAGGNPAGVNQTDYPSLLRSNNLLQGADNVFVNGTVASAGNIERLDYTWGSAFSNPGQLAFAVFDRGLVGAHDAFTIAIITAISPTGAPTAYGGFLKIAGNWGGSTNLVADKPYQLLRYSARDNLTALTNRTSLSADQSTQGIAGIVIRASEFGLPDGTPIFGYSLMGADVNPAAGDPTRVTDTNVYPAGTDSAGGGIDLVALNGVAFLANVPEPSSLAAFGAGIALAAASFARRRRR